MPVTSTFGSPSKENNSSQELYTEATMENGIISAKPLIGTTNSPEKYGENSDNKENKDQSDSIHNKENLAGGDHIHESEEYKTDLETDNNSDKTLENTEGGNTCNSSEKFESTEDCKNVSLISNSEEKTNTQTMAIESLQETKDNTTNVGSVQTGDSSEVIEKQNSDEEDMSVDNHSPLRMPGRGKKRGRSSDATIDTPESKKRVTTSEHEKKQAKVSHPTHANFKVTGVTLALGEGDVGQLGLGEDIIERARPALVKLEDKIVQVCAGGMHTVCLTNQGKLYTFGCNDESALGRDTSEEGSETLPAKLNLPYKIIQVTAGDSHTAALTEDGHVYAWGNFRDANGSMGLTSKGISTDPLEMLPGETVIKIASGGDHLVCLTEKGEIFTGGCAEQGQLGRVAECFAGRGSRKGLDSILKMGPVRCRKHSSRKRATFSDIWAGQYVTFAKEEESGDLYSWGLNNYFQLGFSDMENRFVPEWVPSFAEHKTKWVKVQAGQHHTMLLDENGKVYTIGRAEYGRLGIGENPGEQSEPVLVSKISDKKCIDIAAGQSVSFALVDDGTVFGWGMGTSRQLGTGDEEDVWEPVQMKGKQLETRSVIGISAGGQHTALLAKDKL